MNLVKMQKAVNHESDSDSYGSGIPWYLSKVAWKETRRTGYQKKNRDHPVQSTVKIG